MTSVGIRLSAHRILVTTILVELEDALQLPAPLKLCARHYDVGKTACTPYYNDCTVLPLRPLVNEHSPIVIVVVVAINCATPRLPGHAFPT